MTNLNPLISLLSVIISLMVLRTSAKECSISKCGSIISKCQLLEACKCEAQLDYMCHENCTACLGSLFQECCSCVGICPKEIESEYMSHVKVINQTNPDLFDLYATEEELKGHWTIHQEPILLVNSTTPVNCSMIFFSQCLSQDRCEKSCIDVGASGYRWFEVGCCECLGRSCPGYGVNQLRCWECPPIDQVIDSDL